MPYQLFLASGGRERELKCARWNKISLGVFARDESTPAPSELAYQRASTRYKCNAAKKKAQVAPKPKPPASYGWNWCLFGGDQNSERENTKCRQHSTGHPTGRERNLNLLYRFLGGLAPPSKEVCNLLLLLFRELCLVREIGMPVHENNKALTRQTSCQWCST